MSNEGLTPEMAQSIGQANKDLLESLGNKLSSVELTRNRNGYSWTIKAYSEDIDRAKQKVEEINADWRNKFGSVSV